MPLVALAVACYAAGLLMGLGGAVVSGAAAAVVVAALMLAKGEASHAALATIALAGCLVGAAARRDDRRCVNSALQERAWDAELIDDAAPGRSARATVRLPHCSLPASLRVRAGEAAAGARIRAQGVAAPADRGVRILDATVADRGGVSLAALRARTGRTIDRVFGSRDAPLARALLVADMSEIAPEVRDRFADAGLVHVLSVSGLHVAIIAAAVQLLLGAARVPHRRADLVATALTLAYVALLGAPPAAVRSGAMLAAGAASRRWQRPTSPWAALALGAAAPLLLDPRTAADLGFQLSVAGMASLVAGGALGRRWVEPRFDGWRRRVAGELLTSTVATLVTLPIVAYAFGRVSLVGPVTNLLAGPVVSLLQPTLFLALVTAPCPPVAELVAAAAHPLLWTLDAIAGAGAAVPHAALAVWPSVWTALLLGAAALAGIVASLARDAGRPLVILSLALGVAAWWPAPHGSGQLELHMLDVGQGDAIAVRTPTGRWIVVDAGRIWDGGDAGRRTVVPYLARRGGRVEAFVLSHPHADHVGGAASLIRALRPRDFWDDGFTGPSGPYRDALEAATAAGTRWRRVTPDGAIVIDGVRVRFLAPDSTVAAALAEPNDASTVAMIEYGAVRFLLVGDAERGEEEWLLAHAGELRADVLKVGHHGSRTSSSAPFLDAVRPRLALVSVGRGNVYALPSGDVMADLVARGAEVLRTDQVGTVVVRTDGHHITVTTADAAWTLPPPPVLPAPP